MAAGLSKNQVDKLGERLKTEGRAATADIQLLEQYRLSFEIAHELVFRRLTEAKLSPARRTKTTNSIQEKLRRESIRLTQIQDIAGCRVTVNNLSTQDDWLTKLAGAFPAAHQMDRRINPSHGYRAVHVIPEIEGKLVEIQIRTYLQHRWAELSEKASDIFGLELKYGKGPPPIQGDLMTISNDIAEYERDETKPDADPAELIRRHNSIEDRIFKTHWFFDMVKKETGTDS